MENLQTQHIYQLIPRLLKPHPIRAQTIPQSILRPVLRRNNEFTSLPPNPTPTTITASALTPIRGHPTEVPTTDGSDSDHRSRPVNPQSKTTTGCSNKSGRFRFGTTSTISFPGTSSCSRESTSDPALPPPSTVNHSLRPWTGSEDHALISYKSDTRARPAWKTTGFRLKKDPDACKA